MTAPSLEKRLRPRKTPRQPRAAQTRARILDSAREVFATHGYAAGTTNRIAEQAGLSVGSLYQYFPNKDAILVELVRAHVQEGVDEVMAAVDEAAPIRPAGTNDIEPVVRSAITAMVAVHLRDRRLHQVLFEESPRPPSLLAELAVIEDQAVAYVAELLALGTELHDPVLSARIAVVTIESLVHRFVATDRPLDAESFVDESTRLVSGYLTVCAP